MFFNLEDSIQAHIKHMSLMLGQATEPHPATAKFTFLCVWFAHAAYIGWNESPRAYNFIHEGLLTVEVNTVDSSQS